MVSKPGTIAITITCRSDSPAVSRPSASSGPIDAPAESMKRWKPKVAPVLSGSLESRSSASRGAVLMPFPVRSSTRAPSTQPHAGASATSGFESDDRP